jgi:hypothetical protein
VVSAPNRVTSIFTAVPVSADVGTAVATLAQPIAPPTSTSRQVTGTVSPATATVRSTQMLSSGTDIEVSAVPVDGTTGAFAFTLPISAPVTAAYSAAPGGAFASDTAVAGQYVVQATSAGSDQFLPIDVRTAVAPLSFVFP